MQPSEEIKDKLDIVDVIREYLPLQAAGMNFRAPCPFHREKTPSFMVSPDKQIWHCFGCGRGGDIFSFVMEMDGIEFVEALRLLAPKAGVSLKRQDPKLTSQRNRLLDILDLSRRYYHKVFLESNSARAAREYLLERGIKEETIEEWQIGYSPDSWDMTLKLLEKNGYKENEIFLAGMAIKGTKKPGFYDRFRARIMFPINDLNGNTVGFSARVSPDKEETEQMGKYINSPQTMIYDKSKIIFGLDKAKQEIKRSDVAVVAEGQMDVISAHQAGFKNVVASSGTALTTEQVATLKRYSNNIALAFDMDEAGSMAADRGIREAMQAEMNIKVVELASGMDPDDAIREDPKIWEEAVTKAKQMMQYYFDKTLAKLNLDEIQDKREGAKILLSMIARLGNKIERDHWLRVLSEKIDVKEELLREALTSVEPKNKPTKPSPIVSPRAAPKQEGITRQEKMSELVISLLIKFPNLLEYSVSNAPIDLIIGNDNKVLYRNLIFYYNNIVNINGENNLDSGDFQYHEFREWLKDQEQSESGMRSGNVILSYVDRLVITAEKDYSDLEAEEVKREIVTIISELKRFHISTRMKEIEKAITELDINPSEGSNDNEIKIVNLMEELKSLSEELLTMNEG